MRYGSHSPITSNNVIRFLTHCSLFKNHLQVSQRKHKATASRPLCWAPGALPTGRCPAGVLTTAAVGSLTNPAVPRCVVQGMPVRRTPVPETLSSPHGLLCPTNVSTLILSFTHSFVHHIIVHHNFIYVFQTLC